MYFLENSSFETAVETVKTIFFVNPAHLIRCRILCRLWFIYQTWPESMIWPSNGCPKAKGIMMTDDSMMTVWVRKGLTLSIFKSYIHNKDIKIIMQNAKPIKDLRQCVHNNLPKWVGFPISVGSVLVRLLLDKSRSPVKWESYTTCEWWFIDQLNSPYSNHKFITKIYK